MINKTNVLSCKKKFFTSVCSHENITFVRWLDEINMLFDREIQYTLYLLSGSIGEEIIRPHFWSKHDIVIEVDELVWQPWDTVKVALNSRGTVSWQVALVGENLLQWKKKYSATPGSQGAEYCNCRWGLYLRFLLPTFWPGSHLS